MVSSTSLINWGSLPVNSVQLNAEQMEQAQELALAQARDNPSMLWKLYIESLAQRGLKQWIAERAPTFSYSERLERDISILRAQVNDFTIALLPYTEFPQESVYIPQLAIDDELLRSHFYILICVSEEQSHVAITHVLRYDQIAQHYTSFSLDEAGNYQVPLNLFDSDPEQLLLYLRCSEPEAIIAESTAEAIGPELASQNQSSIQESLTQSVVNTARWLEGQLDEIAQQLSWTLMPPLQLGSALRSGLSTASGGSELAILDQLIRDLVERGLVIPQNFSTAFRPLLLAGVEMRLYALIGERLGDSEDANNSFPEWSLLLILGSGTDQSLPPGVKLSITGPDDFLIESELEENSENDYIFLEAIGSMEDIFSATIAMASQESLTLPPFSFQLRS